VTVNPTDERDFLAFASTAVPTLLPAAHALTGSQAAAERLLTTTLARLTRHWHRSGSDPTVSATRILFREYAGRRATAPPLELHAFDDPEQALARLRHAALRQVPPRSRAVLVLRYLLDRPEPEVAEILGTSTDAVRDGITGALARLRSFRASVDGAAAGPDFDIEAELRQTLRELADAAEPADLGSAAFATARRLRYTRLGVTAAAALALVGGIGAVALRPDPPPPPDLTGMTVVTSYYDQVWYVLDPATGEYRLLGDNQPLVSPDLRSYALVSHPGAGTAIQISSTVERVESFSVQVPGTAQVSSWAPDSAYLAGIAIDEVGEVFRRVVVVDLTTREPRMLELPADRGGSWLTEVIWLDAGRLAVPTVNLERELPAVDAVSVFDLTGALVDELPINTDDLDGSGNPQSALGWLPRGVLADGRFLLAREPEPGTLELAAADLATDPGPYRPVTLTLPDPPEATRWSAHPAGWFGATVLVEARLFGDPDHPDQLPFDVVQELQTDPEAYFANLDTGEVTPVDLGSELPVPPGTINVLLGDAAGLFPDAAHVAFRR
jgi:DNA-directed RNA polymerase specialized sigma24 family protein